MTERSIINVDNGKHTIHVHALKKDSDESSAMAKYLSKTAVITSQDSSVFLTIMLHGNKTITGFQIENQSGEKIEASKQHINEEDDTRFELFEMEQLMTPLLARVQYQAEWEGNKINGDEELRLLFDATSVESI